jgi:hypothetical protein
MRAIYYADITRPLIYLRTALPKDAPERKELEESIRYVYRWMSDKDFRRFLFLADCAGRASRAIVAVLRALGLDKLRQQISERLKGTY